MDNKKVSKHFVKLRKKLRHHHKKAKKALIEKHGKSLEWLDSKSKHIAVGSISGLLLLAHPVNASIISQNLLPTNPDDKPEEKIAHTKEELVAQLKASLPDEVVPLTQDQKITIGNTLSNFFNMSISATLDSKRLNRSYGIIGQEQHLMRYPGDNMSSHFQSSEELVFEKYGMAPGRGAWGYFSPSKEEMTQKDVDREKYYIAVQTFLSPGWDENPGELYRFFKYRKMIVVNPENGKAVVCVIADAGPAKFTGKDLGGSPEVMTHLERVDGASKGPVLYFFVDDPEDTIPLGPIEF